MYPAGNGVENRCEPVALLQASGTSNLCGFVPGPGSFKTGICRTGSKSKGIYPSGSVYWRKTIFDSLVLEKRKEKVRRLKEDGSGTVDKYKVSKQAKIELCVIRQVFELKSIKTGQTLQASRPAGMNSQI